MNEVSSGLQIVDVLQGVPVDVSAITIMNLVRSFIRVKIMKVDLFFFLSFFSSLDLSWATIIGMS